MKIQLNVGKVTVTEAPEVLGVKVTPFCAEPVTVAPAKFELENFGFGIEVSAEEIAQMVDKEVAALASLKDIAFDAIEEATDLAIETIDKATESNVLQKGFDLVQQAKDFDAEDRIKEMHRELKVSGVKRELGIVDVAEQPAVSKRTKKSKRYQNNLKKRLDDANKTIEKLEESRKVFAAAKGIRK